MKPRSPLRATAATLILSACTSEAPRDPAPAPPATPAFSPSHQRDTRGQGPDIILIHGLARASRCRNASADQLDDRYPLHVVQITGLPAPRLGANAEGPVSAPVADEIARYIRESRWRDRRSWAIQWGFDRDDGRGPPSRHLRAA